jgi:acetyl-CoA acetyltransferase
MSNDPVVIVSFARTPMGGFQGAFSGVKATELGATAVKAAVERAGVSPDKIDQIYMGCVLPAGLGQAPARQAALGAGLPKSCRGHDLEQDVRLGPAGRDDGLATASPPVRPTSSSRAAWSR